MPNSMRVAAGSRSQLYNLSCDHNTWGCRLPQKQPCRTFRGIDARLAKAVVEAVDPGRRRGVLQGVVTRRAAGSFRIGRRHGSVCRTDCLFIHDEQRLM